MNRLLRFLFILLIIAMSGAIIFQLFFPSYMGSHSGYGVSVGWQREIGIWNVECGSSCDSHCCQSQIRLVLSSNGSIGFDPRWAWDRY